VYVQHPVLTVVPRFSRDVSLIIISIATTPSTPDVISQ
jgi:hypothetical protein